MKKFGSIIRNVSVAACVAVAAASVSAQENTPECIVNECDSIDMPVYIVDGVELPINEVAPEDIVSIEVIKDPAITRIFYPRVGGVVLITTKSKKGLQPILEVYRKQVENHKPHYTPDGKLLIR